MVTSSAVVGLSLIHILIFDLVKREGPVSRAALAKRTGLSATSMTRIVNELLKIGVIAEHSIASVGTSGRPSTLLEIRSGAAYCLCKMCIRDSYYRVDQANQDLVAQVIEQQLEGLLGTEYIDIVTIAGPANNYITEVRKAGKYGLMEEGWGPDLSLIHI